MKCLLTMAASVLFISASLIAQVRDDFAYTGAVAGQKKWVAITGITNGLTASSGAAKSSNPSFAGLGMVAWDSLMQSNTELRIKWDSLSTGTAGTDPVLINAMPGKAYGSGNNGYNFRAMYAPTGSNALRFHRQTGSGRTIISTLYLPGGASQWARGDTISIRIWNLSPFSASAWRYRAAGTRDSLGLVSDTLYDLSTGFYAWLGNSTDTITAKLDDFYTASLGAGGATNTPPTITALTSSPPSPNVATADSLVTITMNASDAGVGAGLDSMKIYVDGSLAAQKGGITGTSDVLSTTATRYSVGVHTYYGRVRDDSASVVLEPTSGTKTFTVDSNASTPAQYWVEAYFTSWTLNIPGTAANYGALLMSDIDWTTFTHALFFTTGPGSAGQLLVGNGLPIRRSTFTSEAHLHGKPAILCLGGFGNTNWGAACNNDSMRTVWLNNVLTEVDSMGWDGITLDIEPFSNSVGGTNDTGRVGPWIRRLYDSLQVRTSAYTATGKPMINASMTPSWGGAWYARHEYLMDQINLMSYDAPGNLGWGQNRTWHMNPFFSTNKDNPTGSNRYYQSIQERWLSSQDVASPVTLTKAKWGISLDWNGVLWRGARSPTNPDEGCTEPKCIWTSPAIERIYDYNFDQMYARFLDTATSASIRWDDYHKGAYLKILKPASEAPNPAAPWEDDIFLTYADSMTVEYTLTMLTDSGFGGFIVWNYTEGQRPPGYPNRNHNMELIKQIIMTAADTTTRRITSISPATKVAGEVDFTLTVNGTNLKSGDSVFIGADVYRATSYVGPTQLTAAILAADIATAGNKGIYVKNGANTSNTVNLVVNAASTPPVITSASPSTVGQGAVDRSVTISGSNISSGPTLSVSGAGVTVLSAVYVNSQTITATLSVGAGSAIGARNLVLTNNTGLKDTLVGGLTVTPAPTITSLVPDTMYPGTTQALTLTGTNFLSGTDLAFVFSNSGVIIIGAYTLTGATSVSVTVGTNATLPVGSYSLTFVNGDGGRVTLSNALKIVARTSTQISSNSVYIVEGGVRKFKSPDYFTLKDIPATQIPVSLTGFGNLGLNGIRYADGSLAYPNFSMQLGSDGTSATSPVKIWATDGVGVTLSADGFHFSSPLATNSTRGSVIGNSYFDVINGSIEPKDGSIPSTKLIWPIPAQALPSEIIYAFGGDSGTIPMLTGSDIFAGYTFVPLPTTGSPALDPETDFVFWEEFPHGGISTTINGNNALSSAMNLGSNEWFVAGFGGDATVSLTVTSESWGSVSPARFGIISLDPSAASVMGTERGGYVTMNSSGSTYPFPMMAPATYKFGVYTPATTDSMGWMIGVVERNATSAVSADDLATTNEAILFNFGSVAATNDTLYAIVTGNAVKNKIALRTVALSTAYKLKIVVAASSIAFYVNDTLKTTVTTNLPANTTTATPVIAAWNYGADLVATGKNLLVDYYYFKASGLNR